MGFRSNHSSLLCRENLLSSHFFLQLLKHPVFWQHSTHETACLKIHIIIWWTSQHDFWKTPAGWSRSSSWHVSGFPESVCRRSVGSHEKFNICLIPFVLREFVFVLKKRTEGTQTHRTHMQCSLLFFIVFTGCLEPPFSSHPSWTCSSRPQRGSTTAVSCLFASCRAWWRYSRRKHSLQVKLFYVKRRFQSSQNRLATCFPHTAVLMEAAVTFYKYTLQLWNFMKANNSMLYQFHGSPVLTEVTSMFMLCPCKFKNKNKWLALLARHSALVQEAAVHILAENMLWMSPFQKNAVCCQWKCKLDEKRRFWTWASRASRPAVRLTPADLQSWP